MLNTTYKLENGIASISAQKIDDTIYTCAIPASVLPEMNALLNAMDMPKFEDWSNKDDLPFLLHFTFLHYITYAMDCDTQRIDRSDNNAANKEGCKLGNQSDSVLGIAEQNKWVTRCYHRTVVSLLGYNVIGSMAAAFMTAMKLRTIDSPIDFDILHIRFINKLYQALKNEYAANPAVFIEIPVGLNEENTLQEFYRKFDALPPMKDLIDGSTLPPAHWKSFRTMIEKNINF